MTQKFYLHDAATADTGTLPSAYQQAVTLTAAGGATNRSMDGTVGAGPQVVVADSPAGGQTDAFRRFLSAPLAAQTIASGNWTFASAYATGSSFSSDALAVQVYVWRPSTGAKVGDVVAFQGAPGTVPSGAAETGQVGTLVGSALAVSDGDVLVYEVYNACTFGATTDDFYYGGTADPVDNTAATTAASFITAPANLTLSAGGGPAPDPSPPTRARIEPVAHQPVRAQRDAIFTSPQREPYGQQNPDQAGTVSPTVQAREVTPPRGALRRQRERLLESPQREPYASTNPWEGAAGSPPNWPREGVVGPLLWRRRIRPFTSPSLQPAADSTGVTLVTVADADTGAVTDLAVQIALLTPADSGSAADAAALVALGTQSEVGDSASAADAATNIGLLTPADSAAAADAALTVGVLTPADSGAASDAALTVGLLTPADAGAGADAVGLIAVGAPADSGTGGEGQQLGILTPDDPAAGSDAASTLAASTADADASSGSDQPILIVLDGISPDTAVASDFASVVELVPVSDADTASADEFASVEVLRFVPPTAETWGVALHGGGGGTPAKKDPVLARAYRERLDEAIRFAFAAGLSVEAATAFALSVTRRDAA